MINAPIDSSLWELTLPAVRAGWTAAQEYVNSGKYVSRESPLTYQENSAGWPSTVADRVRFSTTGPIDWSSLLYPQKTETSRVVVADVPMLERAVDAVVERVNTDEAFASCLTPFASSQHDDWREIAIRTEYLGMISSIVARAVATGVDSDEDLLSLYLQLERAKFAPKLTGDLVVPVTLTDFGTADPVVLDAGVRVERLTPEFQCSRAASAGEAEGVNPYLVAAATHAIVVERVVISNAPHPARRFASWGGNSQISPRDMEKVERAIQCVHIITRRSTGYNQVLVRPHGWADQWIRDLPPVWKVETVLNYPERRRHGAWNVQRHAIDPERVTEIVAAYPKLTTAPEDVHLAARRSIRAMKRKDDEDRTLDASIGIEALLLDGKAELSYRMALRAAAALCDEVPPTITYELARKVYNHRSDIAHGNVKSNQEFQYRGKSYRSSEIAPLLLNMLLKSRLLSAAPWSKATLEDRILEALEAFKPQGPKQKS